MAAPSEPLVQSSPAVKEYKPVSTPWLDQYYAALAQPKTYCVWARVTACSPEDSPRDRAYYAKYGYEGSTYGIAANQFPKGTLIRVPGYMEQRYPDKFWEVDSKGGSVIRRSAKSGITHIDIKFATVYSARQWGNRWMHIQVIEP